MKNIRVGNIIVINSNICDVIETTETGILAVNRTATVNESNLEFVPWANTDELIKDVELSKYVLDKLFAKGIERDRFSCYQYFMLSKEDELLRIRETDEGFQMQFLTTPIFNFKYVRQFQNIYAAMVEDLEGYESIMELDKRLKELFKIE